MYARYVVFKPDALIEQASLVELWTCVIGSEVHRYVCTYSRVYCAVLSSLNQGGDNAVCIVGVTGAQREQAFELLYYHFEWFQLRPHTYRRCTYIYSIHTDAERVSRHITNLWLQRLEA